MNTITISQLLIYHRKIIEATGGSDGVRDQGLLESALGKAEITFDGQELYPGLTRKISVITYSLIKNHGFVDGNKRIGVAVMLLLLRTNGIKIRFSQEELVQLGLRTAEGKLNEQDIEDWIVRHRE
ncbi:type II toxin-antitoxin system death-on-curing family toxin [Cohnella thailandensis]|uniref:Type II toxin-antitoxin system death-on-curing family toxin n=1 Tax=Cohnella thailandensis TaxID=557557 RepID=A0A841SJC0_9BACL|nr:type II toxin-antitoxin system death-on-curing family toxin [Cohnella thailandensis]MBB6632613.1 type II toxin-antitoxin system death-on-curing family toxin [Cohnella thailandensis]MBP1975701.1 death-on-curing protein [Cohnella thailandensis]